MTIGDRIRYFRKKCGYSQLELSELAQMHHVTIRKYEANMRTPQTDHLYKIADVLGVSYSSLIGISNKKFSLHTVGDVLELVLVLCQSRALAFFGERDENGILKPETVHLKFSPKFSPFFSVAMVDKADFNDITFDKLAVVFNNNNTLLELLEWEKEYARSRALRYETMNQTLNKESLLDLLEKLDACEERKEILELELQSKKEKLQQDASIFWDFI